MKGMLFAATVVSGLLLLIGLAQDSPRQAHEYGRLTSQILMFVGLALVGWWAYSTIRPPAINSQPAAPRPSPRDPAPFPERAGNVLYGLGVIGAALTAAAAVLAGLAPNGDSFALFLLPAAAVPYAVGWTLRYLCSGRLGF